MPGFSETLTAGQVRDIHAYLVEVGHNTLEVEQARDSTWSRVKGWMGDVVAKVAQWGVELLAWFKNAAD